MSDAAGDPAGRGVLPDHEAADGQPEPSERGARLGADVAGHRPLRVLPGAHEGALRLPEVGEPSNQNTLWTPFINGSKYLDLTQDAAPPDRHGLGAAVAEDAAPRAAEVPAAPGRGRGHPAQDHTDIPQGLLPGRHRRGTQLCNHVER